MSRCAREDACPCCWLRAMPKTGHNVFACLQVWVQSFVPNGDVFSVALQAIGWNK